jgi:aminotransferase EvaB
MPEGVSGLTSRPDVAVPLNDLRRGYDALARELHAAADRVLRSGWYVHGPEHAAFEEDFADYLGGGASCVGVGNGTDALEIALRALDLPAGSQVVTAANAGMYASTAIRRAGLQPRYADVDPGTLLLSPDDVARLLDADVSAVIVTHLYGRMADVEGVVALCRSRGIAVLEDCAQAVGCRRAGAMAGTVGDVAAFSFYPTKNLGALGDGGAVVSGRTDVVSRARQLRQYGWRQKYAGLDGGRNSRLDELQAAFLRVRLPHVDTWNASRREVIERYVDAAGSGSVRVLPAAGAEHVAHLAVAVADDRERVRGRLAEAGIGTDVHYPVPDHRQAPFGAELGDVHLPVTERTAERVLTLPCFPELTDTEVTRVCDVLTTL